MALDREAFQVSMRRIVSCFNSTAEDRRDYLETVFEAVAWMQANQFEEVTKEVVKTMPAGRRPVPSQFVAVYHRLAQERGWRTVSAKCQTCSGLTMVYARFRIRQTGEIVSALKACPSCRSEEKGCDPKLEEIDAEGAVPWQDR